VAGDDNAANIICEACPLLACKGLRAPDDATRTWLREFRTGSLAFRRGETVLAQGTWSTAVMTLLSGIMMRYRLLEDGRRQVVNFMFPGDLVGLQGAFDEPLLHGIEAQTDVVLCHFQRERFFELVVSQPRLAYDVTWQAACEEGALEDHLVALGRRSARERMAYLAAFLVNRGEDTGVCDDGILRLSVSQSVIADMLGLSLVHTNRTMQWLRKNGLVEWTQSSIAIPDMDRTCDFAHFERNQPPRPYV
jgi:CRP-like cAMP-binding protein